MISNSDPPRVTTRSMAAKRKAEEAETDTAKKTRLSVQPLRQHESQGVISRSMEAKIKSAEKEKATMNVVISKRGKRRRQLTRQQLRKNLRFSGPYQQQNWSLRESIMYYIIQNPTTKSHKKLIQCCKYFFAKNPIFVIRDLNFSKGKWKILYDKKPLDIAKIAEFKLWISESITLMSATNQNILSTIIPKINRCDIQRLCLSSQTVYYRDFMFIASSVEDFDAIYVTVIDDNDSIVPFAKLFEALPKVKNINYICEPATFTSSTLKELFKIPHFSQLQALYLYHISETFDLDAFYAYMKQNKFTKFYLNFDRSISEAYKNRLEAIIDEVIETQTHDFMPPYIHFSGIDRTKYDKLYDIFDSH